METCREDLAAIRAAAEGAIADAETSPEDRAALGPLLPKLTEGAVRWAASLVLSRAFYFDVRLGAKWPQPLLHVPRALMF